MCACAKKKYVASDRTRRENVPRHILSLGLSWPAGLSGSQITVRRTARAAGGGRTSWCWRTAGRWTARGGASRCWRTVGRWTDGGRASGACRSITYYGSSTRIAGCCGRSIRAGTVSIRNICAIWTKAIRNAIDGQGLVGCHLAGIRWI